MDGNSKNIVTTAKDKAKGNPPLADSSLHPRPKGRGFAEQFDKLVKISD